MHARVLERIVLKFSVGPISRGKESWQGREAAKLGTARKCPGGRHARQPTRRGMHPELELCTIRRASLALTRVAAALVQDVEILYDQEAARKKARVTANGRRQELLDEQFVLCGQDLKMLLKVLGDLLTKLRPFSGEVKQFAL